ncbi:MAG: NirD/YgiW/YdeI family stress tolerance protein [Spirochaetaceae bacterium]|nr:NirD/YgiW/YdeI family stress tolerance protein [Spirochaetaceae bacterium]
MVKKILFLALFVLLIVSTNLTAQFGFGGSQVTVAQARTMRDESPVTLVGHIVRHIRGDYFLFRDDSGEIRIEIEPRRWGGLNVGPNDLVEITGEVDRNFIFPTYIEVRSIRLVQ